MDKIRSSIILVDIVALLLTGMWILYSFMKGFETLELFYSYTLIITLFISQVLNMYLILR